VDLLVHPANDARPVRIYTDPDTGQNCTMSPVWPQRPPSAEDRSAFAGSRPVSFWVDDLPERDPHPALTGIIEVDLAIVGGGYTGLWAALAAKAQDPGRSIAVVEADLCGRGASGRNGGFLQASLTHGLSNGVERFGDEIERLEQLARDNFVGLARDLNRYGIEADYQASGDVTFALEPHETAWLEEEAALAARFGYDVELLDAAQARAQVNSPTYLAGLWTRTGSALVHPGKLAEGLRAAAQRAEVLIFESSPVQDIAARGAGVALRTPAGELRARRAVLATSAYPSPLRTIRHYVAPVYDYALMSEPLTSEQLAAIGWRGRQGLSDVQNQFHYYRLSADNRILWGGYDAVYRYGGPVRAGLDVDEPTFAKLAQHFFTTFPQLRGLRFSHRWGGAIDTCSRFSVFFGTALEGRVAYAVGYTGLGVAASRFGARVALDLVDGRETEVTRLNFVRRRPLPFPPEPLRSAVIQLTRNRLAAADRRQGRRGLWLGLLDRLGLGFDS
jgi:glycine/D-amino acid oxidase-like deaminating enzyme